MAPAVRIAQCGKAEARARLRAAHAYLEVAELTLDEQGRDEFSSVAAGLAVLAGIAASDSICCVRLGKRHRAEDHRGAGDLLAQAVPDGKTLAMRLLRLLDVKDEAHYGVVLVGPSKARAAMTAARDLVQRAGEELER